MPLHRTPSVPSVEFRRDRFPVIPGIRAGDKPRLPFLDAFHSRLQAALLHQPRKEKQ